MDGMTINHIVSIDHGSYEIKRHSSLPLSFLCCFEKLFFVFTATEFTWVSSPIWGRLRHDSLIRSVFHPRLAFGWMLCESIVHRRRYSMIFRNFLATPIWHASPPGMNFKQVDISWSFLSQSEHESSAAKSSLCTRLWKQRSRSSGVHCH